MVKMFTLHYESSVCVTVVADLTPAREETWTSVDIDP